MRTAWWMQFRQEALAYEAAQRSCLRARWAEGGGGEGGEGRPWGLTALLGVGAGLPCLLYLQVQLHGHHSSPLCLII